MPADLKLLRSDIREKAIAHKAACAEKGIDLLIYCTLRSLADQAAQYAIGRTVVGEYPSVDRPMGRITTNAQPGQSAHNPQSDGFAVGYDCVPLRNGRPVWDTKSPDNAALWELVGSLGEVAGLSWSGRWVGSLREMAHFQAKDFKSPHTVS